MTTIYRGNADRLSVADAKRLILETLPPEKSGEIYARVDVNGVIDFEGPIEIREVHGVQIYASFIDRDFLPLCEQLSIQPRMKYRPMFRDYTWKSSEDDALYSISHNEFVSLTELFGLLVVVGEAPEPQVTTLTPAPVVAVVASDSVKANKAEQSQNRETGPRFHMTKTALIAAHKHEWQTIEGDISNASDNGLDAAKAGPRGWWELEAMEWARSKGKLLSAVKGATELARTMNSMASLPGRKYTKGD